MYLPIRETPILGIELRVSRMKDFRALHLLGAGRARAFEQQEGTVSIVQAA